MTLKLHYTEHRQSRHIQIHNLYREVIKENITATLNKLNSLLDNRNINEKDHLMMSNFNLHHSV